MAQIAKVFSKPRYLRLWDLNLPCALTIERAEVLSLTGDVERLFLGFQSGKVHAKDGSHSRHHLFNVVVTETV
eukprot:1076381-Amphidinium_carterae.1